MPAMVAHDYNLSTQEVKAGGLLEFKSNLPYIMSTRQARATQ